MLPPWITSPSFVVEKPNTEAFTPSGGWGKTIAPVSPWTVGAKANQSVEIPAYRTDENLKKAFGIELAKTSNAFEAACKIFGEETNKALWASFNWLNDPLVVANRDIYLKTLALNSPPLDRNQIAAKALAIADEKILKNGVMVPTVEAKDRLAAIRLYTDILGYTGKVEVDNSTKTFTHNEMTIKLLKPEVKKQVTIDSVNNNSPNVKSENSNNDKLPITLKLVGGVR